MDHQVVTIHELERRIRTDRRAHERLRQAKRGGDAFLRYMRERNQAIIAELSARDGEDALGNRASAEARDAAGAQAQIVAQSHSQYPAQYAEDNRRIKRRMEADDMGLREPTANEKRMATRTAAYMRGEWSTVANHEKNIEWHRAVNRGARSRKKARRRDLNQYVCRMGYGGNFVPDPPSGDDDGAAPAT